MDRQAQPERTVDDGRRRRWRGPSGARSSRSEPISFASASLFFKTSRIYRATDRVQKVLVLTAMDSRLIKASPFTGISPVGLNVR
jgi:catabolite regulation protein CreA